MTRTIIFYDLFVINSVTFLKIEKITFIFIIIDLIESKQSYFPRGHVTLQMDLNICTVSLCTRDVTIEVRCRAHSLPHNP